MFRRVIKDTNYFISVLLVLSASVLLSDCKKEKVHPRDYPRVNTLPVSNISQQGAIFSGDLYSLGTEAITEYGFVWGLTTHLDYRNGNKVILGIPYTKGIFRAVIETTLRKDKEYFVKPYVKTDNHIVYGPPVTFTSLGSDAPRIYGFEPDSAGWGDTLKITGKNFSWKAEENIVTLNGISCTSVSSTDTTLIIKISPELVALKSLLSIDLAGNVALHTKDTFRLIPPRLDDFYPTQARWGDTINLKGSHLEYFYFKTADYIKLGSSNCALVIPMADTLLKIIVPGGINTITSDLKINYNGFLFQGKQPFQLLSPFFKIFPVQGTWGSSITLTGRFNPVPSRNTILFNNITASVVFLSLNTLTVQVPNSLSDIKSNIVLNSAPFTVAAPDTFRLLAPVIRSFSPASGPGGTLVTTRGKYFGLTQPTVKFGTINAELTSFNDSVIVARVPSTGSGPVKISVTSKIQTVSSTDDFIVTNPKINTIYPLTGTFNDDITIRGENFVFGTEITSVSLGGIQTVIKSIDNNTIVIQLPLTLDSVPKAFSVRVGNNYCNSTDLFKLSPPEILAISPAALTPGVNITISGNNFNPQSSYNKVFLDIYPLKIISSSSTQIIATLPAIIPRGDLRISVIAGGYKSTYSQVFNFTNSKWLRIPSPEIGIKLTGRHGYKLASGALNNYGYVFSVSDSGVTYRFNPVTSSWATLNTRLEVPFYGGNMTSVVCKDTLYVIIGSPIIMQAINQNTERWRTLSVAPNYYTEDGVTFSFNNIFYYGLRGYSGTRSFYEINPSDNYKIIPKGTFPSNYTSVNYSVSTYFNIGNTGYVLFSNNYMFRFDPATLTWNDIALFPGTARTEATSFILGGEAYMVGGSSGGIILDEIWKYNPLNNSWTLVTTIPLPRKRAIAFTINGKAYVGFGIGQTPLYDFYEFDPNYPAK